jgi:hypothetical protein
VGIVAKKSAAIGGVRKMAAKRNYRRRGISSESGNNRRPSAENGGQRKSNNGGMARENHIWRHAGISDNLIKINIGAGYKHRIINIKHRAAAYCLAWRVASGAGVEIDAAT